MDYYQRSGSRERGTEIILEPEDWTDAQWNAFLEIFDLEAAERIVLADFMAEVYGTPKTPANHEVK